MIQLFPITIVLILFITPISSAAPSHTLVLNHPVVCYLFSGPLADLGYSYEWNIARRTVAAQLSAMLEANSSFRLTSHSIASVSDMDSATLLSTINATIINYGCNILLSLTSAPAEATPAMYLEAPNWFPHVRFIIYGQQFTFYNITFPDPSCRVPQTRDCNVLESDPLVNSDNFSAPPSALPPNVKGFVSSTFAGWFLAGVAAAAQCQRCVGFLSPVHTRVTGVNAFARGMRWAALHGYAPSTNVNASSTTCPLYHIIQDSYLDAAAEHRIASLFLAKGCDILAYWTDDHVITSVVKSAMATSPVPLFTIATNADAGLLYGDVVLVSAMLQVTAILRDVIEDTIFNRSIRSRFASGTQGQKISSISPRASRLTHQAAAAAVKHLNNTFDVLCGGFQNTSGDWLYTGCSTEATELLRANQLDILITSLPDFQRPVVCSPGTEPHYDLANFHLVCVKCPSPLVSSGMGAVCVTCPVGYTADVNQSSCIVSRFATAAEMVVNYGVVVGAPVASLLVASIVIAVLIVKQSRKRTSFAAIPPPCGPVIGLVLVGVDPQRSAAGWRQQPDFASAALCDIASVASRACDAHRACEWFSAGDIHLIATHDAVSAIRLGNSMVADFSQRCISSAHLRLRVVVFAGRVQSYRVVEGSNESLRAGSSRARLVNNASLEIVVGPLDARPPTSVPLMDWQSISSVVYAGAPVIAMHQSFALWKSQAPNSSIAVQAALTKLDDVADLLRGWQRAGRAIDSVTWASQQQQQQCFMSLVDDDNHSLPIPFEAPEQTVRRRSSDDGSSLSLPSVDTLVLDRFAMLSEGDVRMLLMVAFPLMIMFLDALESSLRRAIVHTACAKLHVGFDKLVHHGRFNEAEGRILVSHAALVHLLAAEVLSSMDEQVLDMWLRVAASDRSPERCS